MLPGSSRVAPIVSLDEAIARCQAFHALGADITFLEAPARPGGSDQETQERRETVGIQEPDKAPGGTPSCKRGVMGEAPTSLLRFRPSYMQVSVLWVFIFSAEVHCFVFVCCLPLRISSLLEYAFQKKCAQILWSAKAFYKIMEMSAAVRMRAWVRAQRRFGLGSHPKPPDDRNHNGEGSASAPSRRRRRWSDTAGRCGAPSWPTCWSTGAPPSWATRGCRWFTPTSLSPPVSAPVSPSPCFDFGPACHVDSPPIVSNFNPLYFIQYTLILTLTLTHI